MRRSRRALTVVIALGLIGMLAPTASAAQPVSLDAYIERLSATLDRLDAIPPNGGSPTAIAEALAPLGLPLQVAVPSAGSVVITKGSLLGDAGSGPAVLPTTTARINAALEQARATASTTVPDFAGMTSALDKAYLGHAPVGSSLPERVLATITQALGWLLDRTVGAMARSGIGVLIAWLLVASLLAFAWRFVRRVRSTTVSEGRVHISGAFVPEVDWRRVADAALSAGDLPEAVRALYHLLLVTLAARGVVRDAPSLTAGECRRAVHERRPTLAPAVDAATVSFERVVFGKVPASADDVEILRAAERAVQRA